ncbi:nidogen-like domain-containing protein [Paraglaciecola polaris]|uniref:Nidogen n=1 Tax=Paraglaciecola polaris LMG 21857 TaxID=1129793 RepID=K6Z4R0_9ALTE|nr:nidogen-like domain-containing protein [Paraglaciecola polaris]GAC31206.1 nidogen [Paraglaciecola polaris LMG 21857]|tara:strand:+ start:34615 stop:36024 length:1410 start_codon:yes stop_codon:yes gene_type:complete
MYDLKKLVKAVALCGAFAASVTSLSANASVLLEGWDGAGDSGFGTIALPKNDDGSSDEIVFSEYDDLGFDSGVNFFGRTHNSFYVNNNGNISFNGSVGEFTPNPFPNTIIADDDFEGGGECGEECEGPAIPEGDQNDFARSTLNVESEPALNTIAMIAPFWADVDTGCEDCGDVFIGSPNAETLVITWDAVGFFPSDSSLTNTFQLVLIDRTDTGAGNFDVEFRYEDINWTTGDASEGESGLGGIPAQAGYDAGDGVNFFTVPGSRTSEVVNLDTADSNTGTVGIWKFAIRDGQLPGDNAENPILPVINPETPTDYNFEFVIIEPETPIFIDPDVAVGYDYIVNSGPSITSVMLPTGFGDDVYDLWLWNDLLMAWYDTGEDLLGGDTYDFITAVDRFRILGIETSEMVDPNDPTAFVTALTFDSAGTININQNAITEFVDGPQAVSAPAGLGIFALSLLVFLRARKRRA